MIDDFSRKFGERLAERRIGAVLAPGALFAAALIVALALRQGHALSVATLDRDVRTFFARHGTGSEVWAYLGAAFALLASAGTSFARGLGWLVSRSWLGTVPNTVIWPLWAVTRRRWHRAQRGVVVAYTDLRLHEQDSDTARYRATLTDARRRRDRISRYAPTYATWSANRLADLRATLGRLHGVEFAQLWSAAWDAMPDRRREDYVAAVRASDDAASLVGWGILWCVLGIVWWPAVPVGLACAVRGWVAGRACVATVVLLVENAVSRPGEPAGNL